MYLLQSSPPDVLSAVHSYITAMKGPRPLLFCFFFLSPQGSGEGWCAPTWKPGHRPLPSWKPKVVFPLRGALFFCSASYHAKIYCERQAIPRSIYGTAEHAMRAEIYLFRLDVWHSGKVWRPPSLCHTRHSAAAGSNEDDWVSFNWVAELAQHLCAPSFYTHTHDTGFMPLDMIPCKYHLPSASPRGNAPTCVSHRCKESAMSSHVFALTTMAIRLARPAS